MQPQRAQNKRASYRDNWWIFAEPRARYRASVAGLPRYIATSEVGKHRFFVFLDATVFPDGALIAATLSDGYHLGVLSSRIHVTFALAAGGRMGMGNDPRYQTTRCFDPFPFPEATELQRQKIAKLAEAIDAHRKRAQTDHGLGLTTIYNVLGKLRAETVFNAAERKVYDAGLLATLRLLHDELDIAVAQAYGWLPNLTDQEILLNLVALNHKRAVEESRGKIRWLRPEFQAPAQNPLSLTLGQKTAKSGSAASTSKSRAKPVWPKERPAQVEAVAAALSAAELAAHRRRAGRDLRARPERAGRRNPRRPRRPRPRTQRRKTRHLHRRLTPPHPFLKSRVGYGISRMDAVVSASNCAILSFSCLSKETTSEVRQFPSPIRITLGGAPRKMDNSMKSSSFVTSVNLFAAAHLHKARSSAPVRF
ncbi:MAG: hypothetical protein NTU80_02990 [Verrucomicrobia bacterium]|nr:hypothetical protein [Verrucomicrobiota bacterium]